MKTQAEKRAEIFMVAMLIGLALIFALPIALVSWHLGFIGNGSLIAVTATVVFIHILISNVTGKLFYIIKNKEL